MNDTKNMANGAAALIYDIAIIGGGINGCGIARDAAGRGYSVYLAEKDDLASGTSSNSTKLIHGGLRYLAHYRFRLVREALKEREVLWSIAPHLIRPRRFILPHHAEMRSAWLLRAALFIYDHLGGRNRLPATSILDLQTDPAALPLKSIFTKAFEFSDCWVDDARLVILNARDARLKGADIDTRTEVTRTVRHADHWIIETRNELTGETARKRARLLVNATGPWMNISTTHVLAAKNSNRVRLVKGSHIVVPKLFDHKRGYLFQNSDDRILFALPFEEDFTLIGTTDQEHEGDPGTAKISETEISYLCNAASVYFRERISPGDVIWSYSGVRALYDEGASKAQEATRDYVLNCEGERGQATVINIIGGKITTYRKLAEAAMEKVEHHLGRRKPSWTDRSPLPGGKFHVGDFGNLVTTLAADYPFLGQLTIKRMIRNYGDEARQVLNGASSMNELGIHFGAGLTQREVEYLQRNEWAISAEDILWRRTKLGLRFTTEERKKLENWLEANSEKALNEPDSTDKLGAVN